MAADPSESPKPLPCKYRTGKTLGQGTYSVVKEAIHENGQQYAAKIINKRLMSGREHMVRNEIVVLRRISKGHKNVLTLVDYFETANNLYLITDLAQGGELFDRIYNKGSFYERDAVKLVRSTTSGVAYLHQHGIVHRDLKPENLLFRTPDEDSDLLIADFGLSRIIDEEKFRMLTTTCGTPSYMAPEIFKKTGHGKPVDVWAIGVITYFLLCGYTPFDRDTSQEEMDAILAGDFSFEPEEYWQDVSNSAKDFISRCLKIDSTQRMTAEQCLQHPFLGRRLSISEQQQQQNFKLQPLTSCDVDKDIDLLPNMKTNIEQRQLSKSNHGSGTARNIHVPDLYTPMDGAFSQSPENARLPQTGSSESVPSFGLDGSSSRKSTSTAAAVEGVTTSTASNTETKGTISVADGGAMLSHGNGSSTSGGESGPSHSRDDSSASDNSSSTTIAEPTKNMTITE